MKPVGLTYCTNVHSLEDFASLEKVLTIFGPAIKASLSWPRLPMGMWMPSTLMESLGSSPSSSRERLRDLLAAHGLSTFTFNAFPYGNFHDKVVKTRVYVPDWTDTRRLDYTVACARLLTFLLPPDDDGSVSTLPLGWRLHWTEEKSRAAATNLVAFASEARRLADAEGRAIRLGLEPEPGCAMETTAQALAFWEEYLRPAARAAGLADEDLRAHLGLCYDTCHQAVQFEDPVEVLDRLAAADIPIAKMQLSSALEFRPDPERRSEGLRREFREERFLHQTRIRTPEGIIAFDDLPEALAEPDLWAHPWRVHFHVPIDAPGLLDPARIGTTRDDMARAYRHARKRDLCCHFEVETYTWSVMPKAHRPKDDGELAACITRELAYIEALEAQLATAAGTLGATPPLGAGDHHV
ncbi:MAG TPA: metabolite traffic protein EboE [Fibrobacteria bacterium]|nr:metabolite traffic protein EboE [Fibrobacteria bacterium]